jgi:CheY-like chemotaxis protein
VKTSRDILIVDDDPAVHKLFSRLLTRGGYSITTASTVVAAIKSLRQKSFALVVLDLSMPDVDGFDMLKTLRTDWPNLKVLVISGYIQGALLKASECVGATASLAKTDAPTELLRTVDRLLGTART